MPVSARRNSIASVRPGSKKYVPYRADDFQHGKKTGIAVEYVDHLSDEFEPFEKVMSQADRRTPPKVRKTVRKRVLKTPVIEEDDENGEMSMELDESNPNSPSAYFMNTRVNGITSSVQRIGSSSRRVSHRSDIDYDQVPSPISRVSSAVSRRQSIASHVRSPGPSRLSHSIVATQLSDDGDDFGAFDNGGGGFDADEPPDSSPLSRGRKSLKPQDSSLLSRGRRALTPHHTSFTQLDNEAEDDNRDEEQVEEEVVAHNSNSRTKGKQRVAIEPPQQQDIEMGDDIAQDFNDIQMAPPDESEEEQPQQPVKKTGKGRQRENEDVAAKEKPVIKKPRAKRKENVLREVTPDMNTDGLRRGKRTRYAPLEWWRLEKVVYGRRETGISLVPAIKEIIRIPKEEPKPLGGKHKKKRAARTKSATADPEVLVYNPEEGWDLETDPEGVVLDFDLQQEVEKRVAFTASMVQPKPAASNDFFFQKIFGDGDFIASGQLVIPPGQQKPTKNTKDNTFVFYVIEGAVNFKVHRTSFVITTGGMFLVPRGNYYLIQNISDRDAKLFFAQARKVVVPEGASRQNSQGRRASAALIARESMSAGRDTPEGTRGKAKS